MKSEGPFTISAPSQITASNTVTPTGCGASTIGAISLTNLAGGNGAPYTVAWNGGLSGATISNLAVSNT